jgi:hypothetical protein
MYDSDVCLDGPRKNHEKTLSIHDVGNDFRTEHLPIKAYSPVITTTKTA